MQPDRIQIAVRPRGGWEALDLGFRMAREWWKPLWASWCALLIPLSAVVCYTLWTRPYWTLLALWWLKPALDRVPLHVLSEALFGHVPTLGETLRALPRLLLRSGVTSSLTWLRFTPLRSLALPILQLEGLRGPRRRERTRLLAGREFNVAVGLLFACGCFQFFTVFLGLFGLIWLLAPDTASFTLPRLFEGALGTTDPDHPLHLALGALYAASLLVIEPLYVAAGFSLYINRRVYLEGWDIDLVFRKLARRAPQGRRAAPATAALLAFGLALGAPLAPRADPAPQPAAAEAGPCVAGRPESARDCIAQVERELAARRRVEVWRFRSSNAEAGVPSLDWLGYFLARGFSAVIWTAGAAALLAIAVYVLRRFAEVQPRPLAAAPAPDLLQRGARAEPPVLPVDVLAAAQQAWARGDAAAALSLLYRGAVAHLVDCCGLELPASATEGDCTRLARRGLEPGLAADFGSLTRAWQFCAYGRQAPDDATFAELCRRWRPRLAARA